MDGDLIRALAKGLDGPDAALVELALRRSFAADADPSADWQPPRKRGTGRRPRPGARRRPRRPRPAAQADGAEPEPHGRGPSG